MKRLAYIGIGSNLGDRLAALRCALRYLNLHKGIEVVNCSSIVETPAWGFSSEHSFLNAVLKLNCNLDDAQFDALLRDCEITCGRRPDEFSDEGHVDRHIDVDLLWLQDWDGQGSSLQVPHPRAHQRGFVLVPLSSLNPGIELQGRSLEQWISDLPEDELAALKWREDLRLWPFGSA